MSATGVLMNELRRLGVVVWHDGERLRYRAPKDALTPELRDRLRAQRDEITIFLAAAARASRVGGETAEPIARVAPGPAPLSFAQERLWFLHQLESQDEGRDGGPGAAYNVAAALRLRGPVDAGALGRSLDEIVRRHAILRTRFAPFDGTAVQIVEPGAASMRTVDLGSTPGAARERAAGELVRAESAHVFALDAAPPVRFTLIRLADDDHVLVAVLHHLVTDGWSMSVLMRELVTLYDAFASGRSSPLPDLPLQYADYAAHQRRVLSTDAIAADLAWWKAQLAGAPAAIDLPLDRPRPAEQSYRGALVRFALDRTTTAALKRLARDCNASLFMVLVAGYAALLARYAGQPEVVIGAPVANRDRPEFEPLIGAFSNYIPLRVDLRGEPSVRELIARVRRMTLDGYARQRVPFEKLVDVARPERRLGVAPLFQVALVLQNLPSAPLTLPGIDVQPIEIDRDTAKLEMSVLIEETGGALRGELEYCTDLFVPTTAARMAGQLVHVLGALARDPDRAVAGLALLEPGDRARLVDEWSGAGAVCPADGLVHERFREQAARTPGALAVVAGDERLTYAELAARVSRLARHLAALGVDVDSRVAVCLPRSADLVVTLLAVLEAGGAYLPLDAAHPPERLASIVDDAGAGVVVTTSALLGRVPSAPVTVCVDRDSAAIEGHTSRPLRRRGSPGQLAYVIYTSGSTGLPKGVMVAHRALGSLVRALADAVFPRGDDPINVALVASAAFDASVQQVFGCLLLGHALHVVDDESRQSGERLLDFFDTHDVALSDATPSLLGLLLDAGLGTRSGGCLERLLVGGEALPARLVERLHAQDVGRRIALTNLYGPTECGVDVTYRTVLPGEPLRGASVPLGRPLSNARVYVLDAAGAPAPIGIPGDIWIGGPCLARGYLGQPALSARAYRPDPFVAGERLYASGDRGRWTDGGEIEFLGRTDDQVKVRGYRVELAEVESALLRHPAVKDAVVIVERADRDHARLIAYVVPEGSAPSVVALRDHVSATLPSYMVPSAFLALERFPLNASGKVDRARMPSVEEARELVQGVAFVEPRGASEQALAAVWSAVLGRETISADDRFFALGGDSIRALQVVSRLRQRGLRLDLRDVFAYPTLAAQAARLEPLAAPAGPAVEAPSGDLPLGPVQAAFLDDYPGPKEHFHQALMLSTSEPVDPQALDRAVGAVLAHHDMLRARFVHADGRWVQAVEPFDGVSVVEVVDLSRETSARAALRAHAAARMAATDLSRGGLFHATLYRLADGERVLLAAHHLVVDGVSWRVLIEDLDRAYAQVLAGRAPSLAPVTDSYAGWAAGMRDVAAARASDERAYWLRAERAESAPLPLDAPGSSALHRERAEHRVSLAQDETARLLTSAHDAYATRMDDLLLAGLGRALHRWAGSGPWRVLLESHGREPPWQGADVSRTVGWFTARYPVVLDVAGSGDVGREIKVVKEMLRAVPGGGGTYEAIRHLTGAAPAAAPAPAIAFNYLGQLGRELGASRFSWCDEETGPMISPGAPLVHDLEIIGYVADARLHLAIGYGRGRFAEPTVAALGVALVEALADVVEHTARKGERELTPSDVDYDGFDIDGLDRFVNGL